MFMLIFLEILTSMRQNLAPDHPTPGQFKISMNAA